MTDLRYLRVMEIILLTGMGYFTLLPVIAVFPNTDFFFKKPSHDFFSRPTIDQIQQSGTPRVHVNLPSYEMLLRMGERTSPQQVKLWVAKRFKTAIKS